ncbi:hypothetical protein AAVH_09151 [Aphelenchoides avenae]|nr:hypothetical protein AAVH_09151 [Aphelenchus avenae]
MYDRRIEQDLRPYNAYKPKQEEWALERDRQQHTTHRQQAARIPESQKMPLPPTVRRQYPVPADNTRHENFAIYWGGRARGLDYSEPWLYRKDDNYAIEEGRRFHRMFGASVMIPHYPTARHGRQIILTAN